MDIEELEEICKTELNQSFAKYVSVSPSLIVGLIDRLRAAEQDRDKYMDESQRWGKLHQSEIRISTDLHKRLMAANAALSHMQQSPAVAVPYLVVNQIQHLVADAFNAGHEQGRKNPKQREDGLNIACATREMYVSSVAQVLATQPSRITEQDAKEQVRGDLERLFSNCYARFDLDDQQRTLEYVRNGLGALLNKLNAKPEAEVKT